jgi:diguanylate cyclase (GGDEF)-like protein/PAS domain S-box-containing protein
MHRLLARQLKRSGVDDAGFAVPAASWLALLERVSSSYEEADRERYLSQRSRDLSSAEMAALHTALAEERDTLQAVQRSLADGLIVLDAHGRVLSVNPAAERLLGRREVDVRGHDGLATAGLGGETKPTGGQPALAGHGAEDHQQRATLQRSDGSSVAVAIAVTPLVRAGTSSGAVMVLRDLTDHLRAEAERERRIRVEAAQAVAEAGREALRFQAALLEAQAEASIDGILVVSTTGAMVSFNRRFVELWGIARDVEASRSDAAALEAVRNALEDPDEFLARVKYLYAHPQETSREEVRLRDGRIFDRYSAPVRGDDGSLYGRVWSFRDMTSQKADQAARERVQAELRANEAVLDAQRASEERFRALVQNASDVTTVITAEGTITYQSPASERVLGYPAESLYGRSFLELIHPEDKAAALAVGRDLVVAPGTTRTTQLRMRCADETWREFEVHATNLLDRAAVGGMVINCHDVTDRVAFERQLQQLAFHDPLTDLPNRALFNDRLESAVGRAERQFRSVGVLFIDLDNFKLVNDSLGHEVGDKLLIAVADRLRTCVRSGDTVARMGGDEFTILLEDLVDEGEATDAADRIGTALRAPFPLGGREVFVSASIGVALGAARHGRPDTLLRNADLALYRAKTTGKARFAVFEPSMEQGAIERLELETGLRQALERDELEVYYQPILSLTNGAITEVEALLRWNHPTRGILSPTLFIPLAEETGMIVAIGQWVLETACKQTRAWQLAHPDSRSLVVAVNLSARQFQHPHLVADIRCALERAGLDPSCLRLEITEGVLMHDTGTAVQTLQALKELGIRIAVDDFGTGYSSLAYLKRFPVDVLKIDRSFVDGLGHDPQDEAIVRSVVTLAKTLHLSVTGEGIETAIQQEHLQALGCDHGQGYLYARPLTADDLDALLARPADHLSRAA